MFQDDPLSFILQKKDEGSVQISFQISEHLGTLIRDGLSLLYFHLPNRLSHLNHHRTFDSFPKNIAAKFKRSVNGARCM